jgi:F-type H+-transporting ATPase subunit delta
MESVTQVRQYARALFELCREKQVVDRVASDLGTACRAMESSPRVHEFLFHPEIPVEKKREMLAHLLPVGLAEQTAGLVDLLVQRRHLKLLNEILREFMALRTRSFGILNAEVESVRPLSPAARARLQEALCRLSGHEVRIQEKQNPELLGGVRIKIGDRIIDESVAGRLERIREHVACSGMPS